MDERMRPGPVSETAAIREAVSVNVNKIFDSCRDKDCIEDLRFYPDVKSQPYISAAIGVRAKSAELINATVNVEEVSFNRGYFTVDVRYYYKIRGEAYSFANVSNEIVGLSIFDKRVLLFGSEGNAKVFSSADGAGFAERANLPVAVVEAVDPICLNIRLAEVCDIPLGETEISDFPDFISSAFPNGLYIGSDGKRVYVTLGQFSIIRLERETQLIIPSYDYSMPEKECVGSDESDPCDLFRRIKFPVDEFFPPNSIESTDSYREAYNSGNP